MCGIAGFSGGFPLHAIGEMGSAIAHRGPDDQDTFVDQARGIGLAHRRLSIIDLSPAGHQPMWDAERRVVIVFNGEIYNYRELRSELAAAGLACRGGSDTEVLLNLYLAHGEKCLPKLNGIFAFAIWDGNRNELFLARDNLGVKPLYFTAGARGFAFASEIKALLPVLSGDAEIDPVSLHRYLSFLWCPGDGTPLKQVRKLGPGEALIVREGRILRQWAWYSLPPFHHHPIAYLDPKAAIPGTTEALRVAVHRQLVADVPVGAFLSGGLDSSAVVAMAREKTPDIRCFTIEAKGFAEEGMADDLPYARRVARHLGVPLDVVSIDSSRMATDLQYMVWQLDEPLADPAPLNVLYICRLARESGIKVLLSGAGGDDLFSGYRRHRALGLEALWSWWPRPLLRRLDRAAAGLNQRKPLFRRLAKLFNGAGLEGDARLINYFLWARESQLLDLYSRDFRTAVEGESAVQPMRDFLAPMPPGIPGLERLLALEQRFFLSDHNLIYTDKMSMAVGVEVRVPFLDSDLVEFAARIPPRLKQHGKISKWVLKKAMEPYLPHDVIYRPKSGFGAPLRRWLRHELRELVGDILSEESIRRRGLFDPAAVNRMVEANQRGRVDAAYTILSLLCIEIWCRKFIDSRR